MAWYPEEKSPTNIVTGVLGALEAQEEVAESELRMIGRDLRILATAVEENKDKVDEPKNNLVEEAVLVVEEGGKEDVQKSSSLFFEYLS